MIKKSFYFILFLILGLVIFFYHTAITGFDLMPGDAGDAMLINYILEHFWLWLHQIPQHQSFWNMPFYYPRENTLAYSDVMIGGGILYIPVRIFCKSPFTAMQIWMTVICFVNYTAFYFLMKRLKFNSFASAIGAFFFAFGIMRYFKMNHLNYFIQYPTILALICLYFKNKNKQLAYAGFFGFLSLQFWSVYALGYLFCLFGALGSIVAVCFKETRKYVINLIKNDYKELILYGIIFIDSLLPLANHYLMLEQVRNYDEVLFFLTNPSIWIRNISLLDSGILNFLPKIQHPENCAGIGIFATITAFYGIYLQKTYGKILITTTLCLMVICSKFGDFSLWHYVYNIFPGANGIRVVSRICFVFLILYCFGIANYIQHFQFTPKNFRLKLVLTLTLIILIIEQLPTTEHTYLWSKQFAEYYINEVSKNIPKNCKVLYAENKNQIGAVDLLTMWTASVNNLYSANGSTGILQEKIYENTPEYCVCEFDFEQ
ncbi:hypothetical protein IJ843_02170 [bacterium]|nr:hypothetical protein [bacterium]